MKRQSRIWCGMPFRRLLCYGWNDFRCITHENEIFGEMSYNNACPYDDFANFAPQKKKTGKMPEEMFIYDTDCTDAPLFDRGFTGHEHLYAFGLINMNGRMYDPYMSTFLSPDNFIQCPDNPQNFNRYTHWDKPNVSRVCDDNGNYQYDSFTGDFHPATTERYHSPDDMLHSGGVQSLVMNRYDASYCNGGFTYSIINPPVLRYNFGFLFSIKY